MIAIQVAGTVALVALRKHHARTSKAVMEDAESGPACLES
jgi:hypothetical protein